MSLISDSFGPTSTLLATPSRCISSLRPKTIFVSVKWFVEAGIKETRSVSSNLCLRRPPGHFE